MLLISVMLLVGSCTSCQKHTENFKDSYNRLTPTEKFSPGYGYELEIQLGGDSIQPRKSGMLIYDGNILWSEDSLFGIDAWRDGGLVMIQETHHLIGDFTSYLYMDGNNISGRVRPQGTPAFSSFRSNGRFIYLVYSDYGTFRRGEPERYGKYNLQTGKLEIQ